MTGLAVGVDHESRPVAVPPDVDAAWVTSVAAAVFPGGALGDVAIAPPPADSSWERLYLVGLGHTPTHRDLRSAAAGLGRSAQGAVTTELHTLDVPEATRAVVEGFRLGAYRFDRYQAERTPPATLVLPGADDQQLETGHIIANAVQWARDLVNTPARDKPPARIVELARELPGDLAVTLHTEAELHDGGFGGILAVGRGSEHPPALLEVCHDPPNHQARIVLIGKGVVFDTGGLSMKSPDDMTDMKYDMAGAATVLAATSAMAMLGIPIQVRCLAPLAENAVDSRSLHPGDVITMRNGTSVEVVNTDAEGRLLLADALAHASEAQPDLIIDVATLTAAAEVALGPRTAALFTADPEIATLLVQAADRSGEGLWRLPLDKDLADSLKSDIADLRNVSREPAGRAITAALFLEHFVGTHRWTHIDLGGAAWAPSQTAHFSAGATGIGVTSLVEAGLALADPSRLQQATGAGIA